MLKYFRHTNTFRDDSYGAYLGKWWILLFSGGSWLVLHGVVSVETGRGMFTNVQSQGPETAATSWIFKVRLGVFFCLTSLPNIDPVIKRPKQNWLMHHPQTSLRHFDFSVLIWMIAANYVLYSYHELLIIIKIM